MSEIALYNLLKKIPDTTDEEAKEAVSDIASSKGVATKADITELKAETKADIKDMATKTDIAELKAELKTEMYRMNNRTIMWMVGIGLAIIGVIKYL